MVVVEEEGDWSCCTAMTFDAMLACCTAVKMEGEKPPETSVPKPTYTHSTEKDSVNMNPTT